MATEQDDTVTTNHTNGKLDVSDNPEDNQRPVRYPKQVFFIISNEFCERFCYYGNRTILAIYLTNMLQYTENQSTLIYHAFVMLCYFFPLLGAVIADCYLGKFRTILYLSMLYAVGNICLAFGSQMSLPISHTGFSLFGLFLIALGTGGIKPCVSSFGGDQFQMPEQEKQLASFFSVFYFSINAGSLISTYLTPEIRVLPCFGEQSCYPIAFGVPAILMVVSLIFFVCGKRLYKMNQPEGNIIVDVSKCIGTGVYQKVASKEKKAHWLDYAADKYSPELVEDTKILMELIYLFSPTILFWALYEQQGSRWTFQAVHMNGRVWDFTIMPDQMQVINPILILAFIPLFDFVVYPVLAKLRLIRTSLEKLFWGGVIAAIAFAISAYVEYNVQDAYADLPGASEAQLRIYNNFDCPLQIDAIGANQHFNWIVPKMGMIKESISPVHNLTFSANFNGTGCPSVSPAAPLPLDLYGHQAVSYIADVSSSSSSLNLLRIDNQFDDLEKSDDSRPRIRLVYDGVAGETSFILSNNKNSKISDKLETGSYSTKVYTVNAGLFSLQIGNNVVARNLDIDVGGVYTLLIPQNLESEPSLFMLTNPNSVHILWQLPQLIIISIAEIMFSITGLEFSYSQAPSSMKSVISSLWLLTDSLGNVIIIVLSAILANVAQVYILLVFAILMLLVMFAFLLLAIRYKKAMKSLTVK